MSCLAETDSESELKESELKDDVCHFVGPTSSSTMLCQLSARPSPSRPTCPPAGPPAGAAAAEALPVQCVYRVFIFRSPGQAPYGAKTACAKKGAYPDPPPP